MEDATSFQNTRGTVLATFTQTGTYSSAINLGGGNLVGLVSLNWPGAVGTLFFRGGVDATLTGTQHPVVFQSGKANAPGTIGGVLAFGSGTFYHLDPLFTEGLQYIRLEVGTAGTAGIAAGGTIICVTRI